MAKKQIHCIIKGDVQGIGYRYFVVREASRLNINGWVKNLYNGDVEVVAEGDEEKIERLLKEFRSGHPYARVDDIYIEWYPPENKYDRFFVKF